MSSKQSHPVGAAGSTDSSKYTYLLSGRVGDGKPRPTGHSHSRTKFTNSFDGAIQRRGMTGCGQWSGPMTSDAFLANLVSGTDSPVSSQVFSGDGGGPGAARPVIVRWESPPDD
ncbi:hypothetical protein GCM10009540_30480 [Streptomyces turgidiscabies]